MTDIVRMGHHPHPESSQRYWTGPRLGADLRPTEIRAEDAHVAVRQPPVVRRTAGGGGGDWSGHLAGPEPGAYSSRSATCPVRRQKASWAIGRCHEPDGSSTSEPSFGRAATRRSDTPTL